MSARHVRTAAAVDGSIQLGGSVDNGNTAAVVDTAVNIVPASSATILFHDTLPDNGHTNDNIQTDATNPAINSSSIISNFTSMFGNRSNSNIHANILINSRNLSPSNRSRSASSNFANISNSNGALFNATLVNNVSENNGEEVSLDDQGEPQSTSSAPISLTLPRPDHQRSTNLYVDTPFPHRPTPRLPPTAQTISTPNSITTYTLSPSSLNLRSTSPIDLARSNSPSNFSTFQLHSSSSNLFQNQHHSSTLPSVHRTNVKSKRSFVNPNSSSVNNNVIGNNNSSGSNINNNSNRRNNKLSSSSFSFSTSKSRLVNSGGVIIQTQPTALSFTKPGLNVGSKYGGSGGVGGKQYGGSGGVGGKPINSTAKPLGSGSDLSKSMGDLRSSGRRPAGYLGNAGVEESIICSNCGRCRCEACRTLKPPPSAWLCSGKFLCSPASAVDCISCACCVKAALYHCAGQEDSDRPSQSLGLHTRGTGQDDDSTKELSSCWQEKGRCAIWTCLIMAAVPLPCLLCYFPLTGLRRLFEKGYQRCTSHGCRCSPPSVPASPGQSPSSNSSSVGTSTPPHPRPMRPLDTRLLPQPPPSLVL